MNNRIIYFILAIIFFLQFNKVENLSIDVDSLIQDQQDKMDAKFGDKIPNTIDYEIPSINELVNSAINGEELNGSIDNLIESASSKENTVEISTDGNDFSDRVFNNEAIIETNQEQQEQEQQEQEQDLNEEEQVENEEKEGGGLNMSIIIFIIISIIIIVQK